jgi:threonine/homoserine/homoserine lactone efflux protein
VIPLWPFLAVTVPLVVTPGASTAVVLRNSLSGGTRAGLAAAVGANTGSLCFGVLSALGFAIALERWPTVWFGLRLAGVMYLLWLGLQSLRLAFSSAPDEAGVRDVSVATTPPSRLRSLREGFVTNTTNPALATFYFVILPQFIPPGAPIVSTVLMLTTVHIMLAITWHAVWAAAGGKLAATLASGWPRQLLNASAGTALLALGINLLRQTF